MGNSPSIAIEALPAMVSTDLNEWDMNPKSGRMPFPVTVSGFLKIAGSNNNPLANGEIIELQVQNLDGSWVSTGQTGTTQQFYAQTGRFQFAFMLDTSLINPGIWNFRVHYAGNEAKSLEGCEDGAIGVTVGQITPQNNTPLIVGAIILAGAVGVGYYLTKK